MSELNVTKIENEADSSAVEINRKASDGTIIDLQKDGTTVGSIGSISGAVSYIVLDPRASGSGLRGSTASILATNNTGANNDNAIDLGSSTTRFKDLYLSGGVYLGGTGAANYLDDYEEGEHTCTLTPDSGSITLASTYDKLFYTKIGRLVHVQGTLNISSVSSPSGGVVFSLPFAVNSGAEGAAYSVGSIRFYNFSFNTSYFFNAISLENTSTFNIQESRSGTTSQSYQASNYTGSNQYITIGLTYVTN